MAENVTIVVVPRDRFSSVTACARSIIETTAPPYRLAFLDLGYRRQTLDELRSICEALPTEIVTCGRRIPVAAFRDYLPRVTTPYVAWVDNDTYVTEGWLPAMLDRMALGARVVSPVTLEREGLDSDPRGATLRNHISHAE